MKAVKKIGTVFGIIFTLLIVAAFVVPMVVNVDKYRPMITEKAGEFINGKLEIGKLSLSLWGRVKVTIDGVKLTDTKGVEILSVKDAEINVPLLPLIAGTPDLKFVMNSPSISVVKARDGKMNVMTLVKEQKGGAAAPAAGNAKTTGAPAASGASAGLPAIALKAKLTFMLEKAKVSYKDELTGDSYAINELNFHLKDVSLENEMPYELLANLDIMMMKKIKVQGPLVIEGKVKAYNTGGVIEKIETSGALKMDGLTIHDETLFNKAAGVPLGAEWKIVSAKNEISVPKLNFHLAEVVLENTASTKGEGEAMTIDYKLKTNKIDIAKLGSLIGPIKQYGLKGDLQMTAEANGLVSKIDYASDIKFNGVTLMHESMKQPITVDGAISIITNKLRDLTVNMKAKDFDIAVKGMLDNFLAPRFKFSVNSNMMDLDQLLKASEKAAEARKAEAAAASKPGVVATNAPAVDYNAMLAPLRENAMAAATAGTLDFNFKKIKSTGVVIDNLKGEFSMNNLAMAIKDLSMGIFGGSIKGAMSFSARNPKPDTAVNFTVSQLSTQKMVESQVPFARNTVKGIISASMNIGGAGLNQADINSSWKGTGSMDIKQATFTTMDIGPKIKNDVVGKLPDALKSKVKIPDSIEKWHGEYDSVVMKWSLDKGTFTINEITGKAVPHKGMDLKGGGFVKLTDYGLSMGVDLIDTYNLLNLDAQAKDKRYGHFTLSPKIGNTVFDPKFDWGSTIGNLAKSMVGGALMEKAVSKLPPAVQGKVGNVLNKIGGGNSGGGSAPAAPAAPKQEDVKKALKGLFGH